ncbi:MAG TPA: antibiotic biosynthesis monooxygenase [Tepidiformaceae bacterium]|jgi:quinol monooxygenase YgiN
MNGIEVWAELTVADGKAAEFKESAAALCAAVKAEEPGTTAYEWYFNEATMKCHVSERYASAEAQALHGRSETVRPLFAKVFSVCSLSRIESHGDIPEAARERMTAQGRAFYPGLTGFTR